METPEEQTTPREGHRALKIVIIALALLGLFMVLLSLKAPNVGATPVPSFSGSYSVTTDTTWDSGSATWTGSLYVQSNVKLTMKNCKVTMPNSWFYLYVYDYGTWNVDNVSLVDSQGPYGWLGYYYTYSHVRINNSYIKNSYYQYIQGYDVSITNSSIIGGGYGIYVYSWSGGNWGSPGPIVKNCLISGVQYYSAYLYMYGAQSAKVVFENNLIINNQNWYTIMLYYAGIRFNNNTVIRNNNDGIYAYQPSSFEFNGNVVQRNGGVGLRLYYLNSEMTIKDNVLTDNSGGDIWLYSSKLTSVSNIIGKVSCQGNSELNVFWLLDVHVIWEDGSGPVADALVEFIDAKNSGVVEAQETGSDGWVRKVLVKEYCWNDKGQQMYSPYQVNATKFDIKATTNVTTDHNTQALLVLDNVPPALQVESPVNKMLTNKNLILVRGLTEPGAYCTVNMKPVPVAASGWFEATVNFTTDGAHDIKILCMDHAKNSRDASRTVIIDTKAPPLTITGPTEGLLTSTPNIDVTAETEPNAYAEVNGKAVPVDSSGKLDRVITLEEGDNTIFVTVMDKAGNVREANVTVSLDSVLPNLVILDPTDREYVATQDIKVVGLVEDGAKLKINNMDVRFQGSSFQYQLRLQEGDNTITIEAWDVAGNYNVKTIIVTLDKRPPTLVLLTPSDNMFTNQKLILVSGQTEPTNKVTISGDLVAVDPSTGYFERSMVMKSGANKFVVVATDAYGNAISRSVTVVQDTEAPTLTVLSPDNGTVTNQDTIRVDGITELGASVTVNGKEAAVDKGKFSAFVTLEEGPNDVMVITRDEALNMKAFKLVVIRDSTVDLRVSFPYDGMYTTDTMVNITGTIEAGSTVYVNTNLKASMDMYGGFKAQLSLELGQNDITITGTDHLGNVKTIKMTITREEPVPVVVNPTHTTTSSGSAVSTPWMLAMALFLGLLVGAVIMGGAYLSTRRRMEENTKDQIEEILTKRFEEKRAEEARREVLRSSPPPLVPVGYKGPPIHIAKTSTQAPASMPPGPLLTQPYARPLTSVQGEAVAPSDETTIGINPQVAAAEQRVSNAEARGVDTSKARNSLKLAKFFMSKGDTEKMGKYIQKTNEILDEIGA